MIGDLLGKLGLPEDLDPRKLVDLVDSLWSQREKILDTVNFVWDNRTALGQAVSFMTDQADELVDLAGRLPSLLDTAGGALSTAGDGATSAANMLLGDGGAGVAKLSNDAGAALETAQRELMAVVSLFEKAGQAITKVPLVGDKFQPFIDGTNQIGKVAEQLGGVATEVRGLGMTINNAGGGLNEVGVALVSSGSALAGLSGRTYSFATPSAKPAAFAATGSSAKPAAKKATAKKPAPKKAAPKKAAAKKSAPKKSSVKNN